MEGKLNIYNAMRKVPEEALREIKGGKLKGKSDINPMWRIKAMTEQFGPCGVGWKPELVRSWTEPGAGGEITAFVEIKLYIKEGGQWSEAIPGTGGNMLVARERGELVTNDEAFKMAYTDAISVACKLLGCGADVYWGEDRTKYTVQTQPEPVICPKCGGKIKGIKFRGEPMEPQEVLEKLKMCAVCWQKERAKDGADHGTNP